MSFREAGAAKAGVSSEMGAKPISLSTQVALSPVTTFRGSHKHSTAEDTSDYNDLDDVGIVEASNPEAGRGTVRL